MVSCRQEIQLVAGRGSKQVQDVSKNVLDQPRVLMYYRMCPRLRVHAHDPLSSRSSLIHATSCPRSYGLYYYVTNNSNLELSPCEEGPCPQGILMALSATVFTPIGSFVS